MYTSVSQQQHKESRTVGWVLFTGYVIIAGLSINVLAKDFMRTHQNAYPAAIQTSARSAR